MFMLCSMFIQMFVRRGGVECRGTVSWLWRSSVFCCYSVSAGSVVSLSSSFICSSSLDKTSSLAHLQTSITNIISQSSQEVLSNDCACMFSCCLSFFGFLPSACQNQLTFVCSHSLCVVCMHSID